MHKPKAMNTEFDRRNLAVATGHEFSDEKTPY